MFDDQVSVVSNDFWFGVGTVLSLILIPKVISLFNYPSVESIQDAAKAKVPPNGDNKSLTIWGFFKGGEYHSYKKGIPDQSSYTGRVECFLRLHKKFDYIKLQTNMLTESPRKLVPVANVFGIMVDDSPRIIDVIKQHYGIVDQTLTPHQQAMQHFVQAVTTKSLPKLLHHMLFLTKEGRYNFWEAMKKDVPLPLRPLIKASILRDQAVKLAHEGTAITPEAEIYKEAQKDLESLSTILGDQTYMLGTKQPTIADIDVYIFVGYIFYDQIYQSIAWSRQMKSEFPKLDSHICRMRRLLFPELEEAKS